MSKVIVHWASGGTQEGEDHYYVDAIFEEEGVEGLQKMYLCSPDEEDIDIIVKHFSKSIEPYEIQF